jgi:hypothetical protein
VIVTEDDSHEKRSLTPLQAALTAIIMLIIFGAAIAVLLGVLAVLVWLVDVVGSMW